MLNAEERGERRQRREKEEETDQVRFIIDLQEEEKESG